MQQITGRMVMNSQMMGVLSPGLGSELVYSFAIILISLMIYFGTRELYELSNHKGIKYFRQSFLFIAIAYFFRSFIRFVVLYFNVPRIFDIHHKIFSPVFGQLTLGLFMYFNAMAIFSLLYSVMWKRWKNSNIVYLLHGLSIIVALISVFSVNSLIYLFMNLALLVVVIFVFYVSREQKKDKKSKHNLHIIYTLLFVFWTLNIIDILIPKFFSIFQLFVYLASLSVFVVMLYKVLRKTGAD